MVHHCLLTLSGPWGPLFARPLFGQTWWTSASVIGSAGVQVTTRPHSTVFIGRMSTRHGGGTSTSQVIGCLYVCRAVDTVTDWWQKFHGSWTTCGCETIYQSNFNGRTRFEQFKSLLKSPFDSDCSPICGQNNKHTVTGHYPYINPHRNTSYNAKITVILPKMCSPELGKKNIKIKNKI